MRDQHPYKMLRCLQVVQKILIEPIDMFADDVVEPLDRGSQVGGMIQLVFAPVVRLITQFVLRGVLNDLSIVASFSRS